jgi:hypothetical protein
MNEPIENGTRKSVDGIPRVYYEGYWIKCYEPPLNNLKAKKSLIQSLTRRLFNHMEHGINIPGHVLEQVRAAYEAEQDPRKKRVKGAMVAGALFNRAADIFTHLVDLEASGVEIGPDSDLMHTCDQCLREALEFGHMVKHRNGDPGIDELWGEPFKAFIMSVDDFYESRYLKIAMTMKNIDQAADYMARCVRHDPRFAGMEELIQQYARAARRKCETLRTDDDIYDVWPDFVVAGEAVTEFTPAMVDAASDEALINVLDVKHMLKAGVRLIAFITRARTPMPKSTDNFLSECELYKSRAC